MALASACVMALLLPTTLSTQSKAQSEVSVKPAEASATQSSVTAIAPLPDSNPTTVTASPKTATETAAKVAPAPKAVAAKPAPSLKMRLRLIIGGQSKTTEIEAAARLSVGTALKAAGILVNALDRVIPPAATPAQDGMTIRVQQVTNRLAKRYISVPAQLLYRPTTAIPAGAKQQVQSPREGKIEVVERVWTLNGKVTNREFISKRLSVAPQPRIIALGARSHIMPQSIRPHRRYASAKGYINSFRGGSLRDRMMSAAPEIQSSDITTLRPIRCIEGVRTTGYAAGRAGGALSNWTATGVRCTYGAVAVDPRLIPLGSKLYIEGYGYGFACDTGGAIKGKHIDLAFDSARAAFAHGKRRTRVWILGR